MKHKNNIPKVIVLLIIITGFSSGLFYSLLSNLLINNIPERENLQPKSSRFGDYYRDISLSTSTPTVNYQIKIQVNSVNFDYSRVNSDGSDIRFFDQFDSSLDYWIETWNYGGDSLIWVEVPIAGTTSFRMCYGNVTATSESDGEATFIFFDDFEGTVYDPSVWYEKIETPSHGEIEDRHISVDNSIMGMYFELDPDVWGGYPPRMLWERALVGWNDYWSTGAAYGDRFPNCLGFYEDDTHTRRDGGTEETNSNIGLSEWTWSTNEVQWINSSSVKFYDNDVFLSEHTTSTAIPISGTIPIQFYLGCGSSPNGYDYMYGLETLDSSLGAEGRALRTFSRMDWNEVSDDDVLLLDCDWVLIRACNEIEPVATIGSEIRQPAAPEITILSPIPNEVFGYAAPSFTLSIDEPSLDTTWYSLDYGLTNITFSGLSGTIDQVEWNKFGNETVNIRFYANNTYGNESYSEVNVRKDIYQPIISINSPVENEMIGSMAPSFDLTVDEPNIDEMWYTLDDGVTNVTFSSVIGSIDQVEWDKIGNETCLLKFYVRDKGGNENVAVVSVQKKITLPIITIISPISNELFHISAPSYSITAEDPHLDSIWYSLNHGITVIPITELSGTIDQTEWNNYGNGTVSLKFYANDTIGNVNLEEVLIRKDIDGPIISINSPHFDEGFSSTTPSFDITVIDSHLESMWYTIDGGAINISISSTVGTIEQGEWDKIGNENVTIRFYANDTLGNIAYSETQVIKDTILPVVTINDPDPSLMFSYTPPSYDISITEVNLDSIWYTLNGGPNVYVGSQTGTLDQTEWDKHANGTVTIQFYVSDIAGNIGNSEVTVYKDIIAPIISIQSPHLGEIFAQTPPSFSLSVVETNLDDIWYTLDDGINNYYTSLSSTIIQTAWDAFGNGTVPIKFYVIDLAGNIGMNEITVRKDIIAPIISINSPLPGEYFSSTAPSFDITVVDSQLDSMWYTIDNGLTNIPIVSTSGTIDQTEWDKKNGGDIPIRFYAMDTLGNTGYTEVIVIKDIINPAIIILTPYESEVFGSGTPSYDILITEPNLDLMWYSLDGGTTNIGITSFSGIISSTEWNKHSNGTVTIHFYASDLSGNLGVSEVTVHKDISIPLITILSPEINGFTGPSAPQFEISVQEPNIDLMWYSLDYGITNYYFSTFTGYIEQAEWDKFGNGTAVIQFFVRDEGGNEAFSEVYIKKDIFAPIVTIESPEMGVQVLDYPPVYSISIQEPNLARYWYSFDDGITNISISELTGIIDQSEWNALPDGPVRIRFYAEDKSANVGMTSVIVTKLSTAVEPPPGIPGYDIFLLLGVIGIISALLIRKRVKS